MKTIMEFLKNKENISFYVVIGVAVLFGLITQSIIATVTLLVILATFIYTLKHRFQDFERLRNLLFGEVKVESETNSPTQHADYIKDIVENEVKKDS